MAEKGNAAFDCLCLFLMRETLIQNKDKTVWLYFRHKNCRNAKKRMRCNGTVLVTPRTFIL